MKILAVAALSSALLLSACDNQTVVQPSDSGSQTGMVVVGVGKVDVRPDTLVVSMGVESNAPTAPEALEAMTTAADDMIEAIRDAGVAPEDLQTVSLSVREVRPPRVPIDSLEAAASSTIPPSSGFVGTQRLRVWIHDLENGGAVIEKAVEAAGPDARVFGMSLTVDDPDDAIAQARTLAVEDALATGEELAETAGVDLGEPIAIEEISAPDPASTFALDLPVAVSEQLGGAVAAADSAAKIEPGVRTLDVRVQVRFEID